MRRRFPPIESRRLSRRAACLRLGTGLPVVWAVAAKAAPLPKGPRAPPAEVAAALPDVRLHGSGRLTFFGLHVYDARLWVGGSFAPGAYATHPLALELEYARSLEGALIAERSLVEMRKLRGLPEPKARAWLAQLRGILPNVGPGDRLTGVQRPGQATQFFFNGQARGEVADAEFTSAFFSIWLSPGTSEPQLRLALLSPQAGGTP